jgi:hypothetical protein
MANNSINLVDLDHNTLKENLISYLRNQDQFKDYDFEGSNMNVIMDILSHNTFKNAFFLNMIASESFLDSAQMTNSILSHAKELNYTPRSKRSSKASITVSFEANGASQPYLIPKGSTFTSIVKNDLYIFSTAEPITIASANTSFSFDIDVYEGSYFQDSYLFNDTIEFPKFKITNKDVDTTSLSVIVYEDNEEIGKNYSLSSTLLDLNENSTVFFLQASQNGYYEVVFGDNVLGKKPKNNAIIKLDYRVAKGKGANGARQFSINFDPTNPNNELESDVTVEARTVALNGDDSETDESIRFYAPRHFQVQERAVTASDYIVLLKTQFPEINSVSVYGGEEVIPPRYGKVFVAIDISNVDGLPDSKKNEYYSFLKSRSPLSIDPIFIEPDFLYYRLKSNVRFNLNTTTNSRGRVLTLVTNAITNYNSINLDDFNSTLRYSKLIYEIDNADSSIVSNNTDIDIYKKINVTLGVTANYVIEYGIPLKNDIPLKGPRHPNKDEHTLQSSIFSYNGEKVILEDNGEGKIMIIKFDNLFNTQIVETGTIDYDKGIVYLNNFKIDTFEGAAFKIYVKTADKDITTSRKTILTLEPSELNITTEAIRI